MSTKNTIRISKTRVTISVLLLAVCLVFSGCQIFKPPAEKQEEKQPEYKDDLQVRDNGDSIVHYDAGKTEDIQGAEEVPEGEIVIGSVSYESGELDEFQEAVDNGQEKWRLDPEQVLIAEKEEYGFYPKDKYALIQQTQMPDGSTGLVYSIGHGQETYIAILALADPEKGEESIWIWKEIQKNEN